MRWKTETYEEYVERAHAWKKIFAFVPHRTINGNWVWLEVCERKFTRDSSYPYAYKESQKA